MRLQGVMIKASVAVDPGTRYLTGAHAQVGRKFLDSPSHTLLHSLTAHCISCAPCSLLTCAPLPPSPPTGRFTGG